MQCLTSCFQKPSLPPLETDEEKQEDDVLSSDSKRKPGGWKAMPFILGNETFERLATFGMSGNLMVYLMKMFRMEQVSAANVINIWSGISNFGPLAGAFISDAYAGRFKTIAFASFSALLGMVVITLTAWLPFLHPECDGNKCEKATTLQLLVLCMGLGFLSIGTGGIRPCSIPFGVDQFDKTTEEGKKGIRSFFNWYYATFTLVSLLTLTVVIYIQDAVSWVVGFGIPTLLMLLAIILFFIGTKIYIYVKPEGSIFSAYAHVFSAAYKKRKLKLPNDDDDDNVDAIFYDPPLKETVLLKLPLTNQYSFLNKAAIIQKDDLKTDGSCANPWRLCSVQQIEEVKTLFKVGPIWASGIITLTAITQQGTFSVSQALRMDRHLGPKFQIPAGSVVTCSMMTIALWLTIYDRILVPALQKLTKQEGGITLLQRIGIGIILSILAMTTAGIVERERRARAISNPGAPMSIVWLVPQLVLIGLCEAFSSIGHIEFYNKEFPEHMRSIATSLFFLLFAGAGYVSTLIINVVHKVTRTRHHQDWLTNDLNAGKLEYYYFIIAALGILNFLIFLLTASRYQYKRTIPVEDNHLQ